VQVPANFMAYQDPQPHNILKYQIRISKDYQVLPSGPWIQEQIQNGNIKSGTVPGAKFLLLGSVQVFSGSTPTDGAIFVKCTAGSRRDRRNCCGRKGYFTRVQPIRPGTGRQQGAGRIADPVSELTMCSRRFAIGRVDKPRRPDSSRAREGHTRWASGGVGFAQRKQDHLVAATRRPASPLRGSGLSRLWPRSATV